MSITGSLNIRDISDAAYPSPLLEEGVLLRGESTAFLSEESLKELISLGITTIIDLRNDSEISRQGVGPADRHYADGSLRYLRANLNPSPEYRNSPHGQDPYSHLAETYLALLDHGGESLAEALNEAFSGPGGTYVHCAIGKDRTGIVMAVISSMLGVSRDKIIRDYMASTTSTRRFIGRLADDPNYPEFTNPDLSVILPNPDPINEMLDAIESLDENLGGLASTREWLEGKGLDTQAVWKALVLESLPLPATDKPMRSSRFGDRRLAVREGD